MYGVRRTKFKRQAPARRRRAALAVPANGVLLCDSNIHSDETKKICRMKRALRYEICLDSRLSETWKACPDKAVCEEQVMLMDIYHAKDGQIVANGRYNFPLNKQSLLRDLDWDLEDPILNEYLTVLDNV